LHQGAAWDVVARLYGENAFLAILTAAFTPIPYNVFTIAAGVFNEQVPFATLVGASAIGRTARFMLVAAVIWKFGPPVKRLLDRYFEWFTVLFAVLLIGSFFAIKYLF
jgi:membrane protein YqaA with SNARE-associated domain